MAFKQIQVSDDNHQRLNILKAMRTFKTLDETIGWILEKHGK